ncbi:hypothetical protein KF840_02470 [bacterium]|nr:hypothetical protein [bacterium]
MATAPSIEQIERALRTIDPAKRRLVASLVSDAEFAAPLVASFATTGVSSHAVQPQSGSNLGRRLRQTR